MSSDPYFRPEGTPVDTYVVDVFTTVVNNPQLIKFAGDLMAFKQRRDESLVEFEKAVTEIHAAYDSRANDREKQLEVNRLQYELVRLLIDTARETGDVEITAKADDALKHYIDQSPDFLASSIEWIKHRQSILT